MMKRVSTPTLAATMALLFTVPVVAAPPQAPGRPAVARQTRLTPAAMAAADAELAGNLSELAARFGDPAGLKRARSEFERALKLQEQSTPHSPELIAILDRLTEVLLKLDEPDQARPLLLRG